MFSVIVSGTPKLQVPIVCTQLLTIAGAPDVLVAAPHSITGHGLVISDLMVVPSFDGLKNCTAQDYICDVYIFTGLL